MADRFSICLAAALREETGYQQPVGGPYLRHADGSTTIPTRPDGRAFDDDKDDPGGRTGMGILQREFSAYCRLCGKDSRDVWTITDPELRAIYQSHFWDAAHCDQLPAGVDLQQFDIATNQGVGISARLLQTALGVKADGHIGTITIDAAHRADAAELVAAVADLRRARYRVTRAFWKFGKNWLERADRIEREAAHDAEHASTPKALQPPRPDPGAVTASPARAVETEKTVATSGTVKASLLTGGGGGLMLLSQINEAASQTRESGLLDFVGSLATDPKVAIPALILFGSLYIFRERLAKILTEGV